MLWLPTSREEKYKAKQTVDTFVVRSGDVLSAGYVFAGTTWLQMRTSGFAELNIVLTLVWIVIAWRLLRTYKTTNRVEVEAAASAWANLSEMDQTAKNARIRLFYFLAFLAPWRLVF